MAGAGRKPTAGALPGGRGPDPGDGKGYQEPSDLEHVWVSYVASYHSGEVSIGNVFVVYLLF